jgi:hypothetical protein
LIAWASVPGSAPSSSPGALPAWLHAALLIVFALAGGSLIIAFGADRRSRTLGMIFVLFASMFADPLAERALAADVAHTPLWRLLISVQPAAFLPALYWQFAETFPRGELPLPRWLAVTKIRSVAVATGIILFAANLPLGPVLPAWWSAVAQPLNARDDAAYFWVVSVVFTLAALLFMVAKTRRAERIERRRVRVFEAGLLIGSAPLLVHILLAAIVPAYDAYFRDPERTRAVGYVTSVFVSLIPITTGYAVVVDRIFDVRFIIRRALQYLLARYTIIAVSCLPVAMLAAYIYEHRELPIGTIFAGTSPALWWLLAAAASVFVARQYLLTTLDRRFFREHYDARSILLNLANECRRAASTTELVQLLTREVNRALHVDRIAVLLQDKRSESFCDTASAVPPLARSSALSVLVGGAGTPLDVDLADADSPLRRLPAAEQQWLADTGAQLLVPLLDRGNQLLGILLLGDKMSEMPFTKEDRLLLTASGASAAIVLEHRMELDSGSAVRGSLPEHNAVQCRACGVVEAGYVRECPQCGTEMRESLLPLVLGGKFRVERHIGTGGMGIVYRGRDLSLQRQVALKTLPRISPEETARLRREARAMASLHHPSLAMIYSTELYRGLPVLVLEFLARGTLGERLRREPMRCQELVPLGLTLSGALDYLHRAGVMHGDIKPSNIGFTDDGTPKLLDFGLARLFNRGRLAATVDHTTTVALPAVPVAAGFDDQVTDRFVGGTLAYMAPEALDGARPHPSFDLWGLALTLLEATIGHLPRARVGRDERPRDAHSVFASAIDTVARNEPSLADFFRYALARLPENRPQTASDFIAGLQHVKYEAREYV